MADDELSAPLGQNAKRSGDASSCRSASAARRSPGALGAVRLRLRRLGAGGQRPARRRAGRDGRDRLRSAQARNAGGGVGRPAQGPRSYDGPGDAAPTMPVPPRARRNSAAAAPPSRTPTPSPSSTARTGKRQEVPIPASQRRRARRSSSACSKPRATARSRASRRTARGRPRSMPAPPAAAGKQRTARASRSWSTGLGVSANVTQQAIEQAAGPVTFAFGPMAPTSSARVRSARAEGHEVLLQVPMEPFDYPDNDPGPQTLLTSLSARPEHRPPALADEPLPGLCRHRQLHGRALHLDRAGAGAGAEGSRAARADLRRRRLVAAQPRRPDRRRQQPAVRQGRDRRSTRCRPPPHIDRALARLEALARERGIAVGVASALPASIERIAQWAKAAESRGFVLVPISAVAIKPKSS